MLTTIFYFIAGAIIFMCLLKLVIMFTGNEATEENRRRYQVGDEPFLMVIDAILRGKTINGGNF